MRENRFTWGRERHWIGDQVQERVPVIEGVQAVPNLARLKHFGAAASSSGGVEMYHLVGITPEAPSLEAAIHLDPDNAQDFKGRKEYVQAYLDRGMPFHAHETFELRWRVAPDADRAAWRALAQWGAALTHAAQEDAAEHELLGEADADGGHNQREQQVRRDRRPRDAGEPDDATAIATTRRSGEHWPGGTPCYR